MILVRNVFRLKYGQARPALAVLKEGKALMERMRSSTSSRAMTDLVGRAYTVVLEDTYPSLAAFESEMQKIMGGKDADEWRAWYQRFTPFVESGYREIYNVLE